MGSRQFSVFPEQTPHLEAFIKERATDFSPCYSPTRSSSSSFLLGTAFRGDSALRGHVKQTPTLRKQPNAIPSACLNLEKQEAGAGRSLQGLVSAAAEGICGK